MGIEVIALIFAGLAIVGYVRWQHRRAVKHRIDRQQRRSAYKWAWDLVYGRRARRRLTYRGDDRN